MILHETRETYQMHHIYFTRTSVYLAFRDCVRRQFYRCRSGQGALRLSSGWEEDVGSYSSLQEEYHFEAALSTCHCPQEKEPPLTRSMAQRPLHGSLTLQLDLNSSNPLRSRATSSRFVAKHRIHMSDPSLWVHVECM